jgi:diadenylate cyclase
LLNGVSLLSGQTLAILTQLLDWLLSISIFYLIYLIVKRTRAMQLLMGVAFVFLLNYLGGLLNLRIFRGILQNAITALVVALPVVFQPELREILGKLGSSQYYFRRYFSDIDPRYPIRVIVNAMFTMADRRIGALVVLERGMGLHEYSLHGIRINGEVSQELLEAFFHPDSPLHDGAVLIRDGKILAAGCVLPLSKDASISRTLGTRHRAGLGISEMTDAIALMASEESGKVSIAYRGELKYDISPEFLKGFLESILGLGRGEQAFISLQGINLSHWFKKH